MPENPTIANPRPQAPRASRARRADAPRDARLDLARNDDD